MPGKLDDVVQRYLMDFMFKFRMAKTEGGEEDPYYVGRAKTMVFFLCFKFLSTARVFLKIFCPKREVTDEITVSWIHSFVCAEIV